MSPLLEADDVHVSYRIGNRVLEAVRGVTLGLERGERLGLIGESGSGKSSLARALLGLETLASGSVRFDGRPMHGAPKELRRRFQPVFQDAGAALNPRLSIRDLLVEPFAIHRRPIDDEGLGVLLNQVQLSGDLLSRFPRELSVGQRQRVNIARALALEPELLLLDEPVSALDLSVQAQILNLLASLTAARNLTLLLIAHDLPVVAHLCTHVAVMYAGRIVESGSSATVLDGPKHPFTRLLLESQRQPLEVSAESSTALVWPRGCDFGPRCKHSIERCQREAPALEGTVHRCACFVFRA